MDLKPVLKKDIKAGLGLTLDLTVTEKGFGGFLLTCLFVKTKSGCGGAHLSQSRRA